VGQDYIALRLVKFLFPKVKLPRQAADTTWMQKVGPTEPARLGHNTILLVEDESAILKLTTRLLEGQGYTVQE